MKGVRLQRRLTRRCSSAQICSQLTTRLERQEAAHRQEMDAFRVRTLVMFTFVVA